MQQRAGRALSRAARSTRSDGIENANQDTLYGIFGNAPWTNKDKLSDARLLDLIEHFSTKALTNAAVTEQPRVTEGKGSRVDRRQA